MLLACLLAACQAVPTGTPIPTSGAPTTAGTADASSPGVTPGSLMTPGVQETVVGSPDLTIWVPPQFDPNSDTPAGVLLKARIDSFTQANQGVRVTARVKAAGGAGGLLESLTTASAAAPASLPDLIALPREALETAALKGLITPLDGLSTLPDDPDWYSYAHQLGQVGGSAFGLPFAADALAVLYRPGQIPKPPVDWAALISSATPLAFSGGDSQALFPLAMLINAGGSLADTQGRPTLPTDALEQVLRMFQDASAKGIFPNWAYQYENDNLVWEAYRDRRASAAVTWVSHFLSELPPDTTLVPLPSMGNGPISLATGWVWALSTPQPDRRSSSVRLAEYLSSPDFLADFTAAAGYMPPRPSALAAWKDRSMQALISQVELTAQAQPNYDLIGSLGPVMHDAVFQVLKDQVDPGQAAQTAAGRLKGP